MRENTEKTATMDRVKEGKPQDMGPIDEEELLIEYIVMIDFKQNKSL